MNDVTSPTTADLAALADRLESAAFRWGAVSSTAPLLDETWSEGAVAVRAARTALLDAIQRLLQDSRAGAAPTPFEFAGRHVNCPRRSVIEGQVWLCLEHHCYLAVISPFH